MTNQEMFDLAVKGLRGQKWERSVAPWAIGEDPLCVYDDGKGKRCAWGHVDTSLTSLDIGGVFQLNIKGRGLAATLTTQLDFAAQLQRAHDRADTSSDVHEYFRLLAAGYQLSTTEMGPPP